MTIHKNAVISKKSKKKSKVRCYVPRKGFTDTTL